MIAISSKTLLRLSDFVADQTGLNFPQERWKDLERGIKSAAQEFRFTDAESCIQWLLSSPLTRSQIEILSSHLTVGETYFFRDRKMFDVLQQQVLPELIQSRRETGRRLRIWSAACCTGEEPYSVAILLHQLIPDIQNWNITILGTDINPRFLRKAIEAKYGPWSFRDSPQGMQERYFLKTRNGRFSVLPAIAKRVVFSYLNLAEDSYPSLLNETNAMDLILCRNVLMYFETERAKRVIEKLYRSLVEGGWLIVSPTEASAVQSSKFRSVNFPGVFFFRRDSSPQPNAPHHPILPYSVDREGIAQVEALTDAESWVADKTGIYEKALASYQEGDYSETAELLSEQVNDAEAACLLARTCANQGKIEEARNWIEQAIEADKLNAVFHYLRATILQEQGQVETAIASLKAALYIDPNFVLAHFTLGILAVQQGNVKEFHRHFQSALTLLQGCAKEDTLPESDGITVGRMIQIIHSNAFMEGPA